MSGTSGSGKSTLTTSIMERLADAAYQLLIIDPEGDYTALGFATHIGNPTQAPRPEDVTDALKDSKRSIVVIFSVCRWGIDRSTFRNCRRISSRRRRIQGRPHWLVIDEAHHLLARSAPRLLHWPHFCQIAASCSSRFIPGAVEPTALANVVTLLMIGGEPANTVAEFCKAKGDPIPRVSIGGGKQTPDG